MKLISLYLKKNVYVFIFIILLALTFYFLISVVKQDMTNYSNKINLAQKKVENVQQIEVKEPIYPIPELPQLNPQKIVLGNKLFHDSRLSGDEKVSCATCHNLRKAGVDLLPKSIGVNGQVTNFNALSVYNSGFNFKQNWDGVANTLEEQIEISIPRRKSMASDWNTIVAKLKKDPEYSRLFREIYPEQITKENIKDAIATFERSLITPNSRFDKFLSGDKTALTKEEKAGYAIFKEYGCVSCHQGVNIGGNLFQKFGIIQDAFIARTTPVTEADYGRFNITGKEEDRYVFKVPSLRNISKTFPYFHDGSVPDLESAVSLMAEYQLGRNLSKKEVELIVKFLKTLEGEYQGEPI